MRKLQNELNFEELSHKPLQLENELLSHSYNEK